MKKPTKKRTKRTTNDILKDILLEIEITNAILSRSPDPPSVQKLTANKDSKNS